MEIMEIIEIIALVLGYIFLTLSFLGILKTIWEYAIYGEISNFSSQQIDGKDVYINGKLVHTCESDNISAVNGRIYENGKLTYKHIRKKRWEKWN